MKKFFKKLWLRIFIRVSKKIHPSLETLEDNEKLASAICRTLIKHPESTFLIAPLSQKRYIRNEVMQMFIILQDDRMNITNHIYNYDILLTKETSDRLNRIFDYKVEEARSKFEKEMKSQIRHSLFSILEKLSN
jgi:hypothetical protein